MKDARTDLLVKWESSYQWLWFLVIGDALKSLYWLGVVACTCHPATLDAEFQNVVGSILVGVAALSKCVVCVTNSNPAKGEEPD